MIDIEKLWRKSQYKINSIGELLDCMDRFGCVWQVYKDGRERAVLRNFVIHYTLKYILKMVDRGVFYYPESNVYKEEE